MTSRSLGHRAPLLWIVIPMLAGLALGQPAPSWTVGLQLAIALAGAMAALVASFLGGRWWAPALVIAMLFAGSASYTLNRARLEAWDALPLREVRLELQIDRVFAASDARKTSGLATVVRADAHLSELTGQRLYFSLALRKGDPPPIRSAIVSVVGILGAIPRDVPSDTFDGYLAGAGMNFRLTRGRVVATTRDASRYHAFCRRAADRFSAILSVGIAEKRPELTGVLRAMLLGQKHELSDEQDALFMRSGTMHLFAISGLHIGVIAVGLHALLAALRLPGVLRFVGGLAALWLYVEITGATPSAVRAFVMVALVQASLVLRTPPNPLAALAASALIVALAWPLQVFSASFQMSYGIVAALLLFGLPLGDFWREHSAPFRMLPVGTWRWHHRALDSLHRKTVAALAIGAASTLMSTLFGVLYFKLFTPAALLANLVLIPVATLVILSGFASLVCGLLGATWLSGLFNHAAALVLWAIDACVRAIVLAPGAWHPAQFTTTWIGPAALVAFVAAIVLGYAGDWTRHRGGWWPPFAIVAVVLIFGVTYG